MALSHSRALSWILSTFGVATLIVSGCGGSNANSAAGGAAITSGQNASPQGSQPIAPAPAESRPAQDVASPLLTSPPLANPFAAAGRAPDVPRDPVPFAQPVPVLSELDPNRVAAMGIRKIEGRHLTLYTDLPTTPAVDELPAVFDLAVPQWCAYFDVDYAKVKEWRLRGSVMQQSERFQQAGLLPTDLPPFRNGFNRGLEFWLYEQPSDYYRRHLMLHEGTHGFMQTQLGGAGPPWYMEGTAELMATHLWREGQLTLRHFPQSKQQTPEWGRITLVRESVAAGRSMPLTEIMKYSTHAHLETEPYAWCWAASMFFDTHPAYQAAFRGLRRQVADGGPEFSRRFCDGLQPQWPQISEQWQVFLANLEYGYDVARNAITYPQTVPLAATGATVTVVADRGWQSTGLQVQAGVTYELAASGRYQLAQEPKVWWSEPNGVTLRYHAGKPLGMLLAAVSDLEHPEATPLVQPEPIGLGRQLAFGRAGTLFLRINDSPAELADNAGTLTVQIRPVGVQPGR